METKKESYNTEFHKTVEKISTLKTNQDTDVASQVVELKKLSVEKRDTLNKMIKESLDNKGILSSIEAGINTKFHLENHLDKITSLEASMDTEKKKSALELIEGLKNELNRVDGISLVAEKGIKTPSETPKEKQKSDLERKKTVIQEVSKTDTTLGGYLKELSGSSLEQAPYENNVLSKIFIGITVQDATLKNTLQSAYDALKKDAQNPALRLNFLKIIHTVPAAERAGFSENQMIAAENIWRARMNNDKGPKGERALPATLWTMVTLEDIKGAPDMALLSTTPGDVEKKDTAPAAQVPTDKKTETQVASSLEWNADNKEKIIGDVIKSATAALQTAKSIDFSSGATLNFKANGQECVLGKDSFTIGKYKVAFSMEGKLMGDFKKIYLKQVQYKTEKTATLLVDASAMVPTESNHKADLEEAKLKDVMLTAVGRAYGDTTLSPEVPILEEPAVVKMVFA